MSNRLEGDDQYESLIDSRIHPGSHPHTPMRGGAEGSGGVELRHLRSFRVLAETLHFGRAAERLGIAQPALSQQIRRLEDLVGTPLLQRTSRRVTLTDAGETLRARVPALLGSVDRALDATRRAGEGTVGTLRVAFAASVMFHTLPALIRAFRERFPDVQLELRELPTGLQIPALLGDTLDVGFVREPAPHPELSSWTTMREPLVLAISKARARALFGSEAPDTVTLSTLEDEPFVLFPPEVAPGLHAQVMALCADAGFSPRVVQESRELYTTVSLVEAGVGVTLVPDSIRKMGWRGVAYLPLPGVETRVDMAWVQGRDRPVVRSFVTLVQHALTGEVEGVGGEPPGNVPSIL
jgi:DNA-binding transcriptional LysR family regulator